MVSSSLGAIVEAEAHQNEDAPSNVEGHHDMPPDSTCARAGTSVILQNLPSTADSWCEQRRVNASIAQDTASRLGSFDSMLGTTRTKHVGCHLKREAHL